MALMCYSVYKSHFSLAMPGISLQKVFPSPSGFPKPIKVGLLEKKEKISRGSVRLKRHERSGGNGLGMEAQVTGLRLSSFVPKTSCLLISDVPPPTPLFFLQI